MSKSKWKNFLNFLNKKKIFLIILLIILIVSSFFIYRSSQKKTASLNFVKVEQRDLSRVLSVSGIVDAKNKVDMFFATGGKLVYLGATEGSWVKKGETLAIIDRATLGKQLEQNLNNYESERASHENLLDTYQDRVITDTERLTKTKEQLTLQNAVINVELNSIAIQNTVLSAPFAGILTHTPQVVAGVQLAATDYFEVVDPDSLVLKTSVDEMDLADLQLGQKAKIHFDAYDQEELTAELSYISYVSRETATGTVFTVEFTLSVNTLEKYRIGMNADAEVELERKEQVLALPIEAVRQRDGKYFVDIKNSSKGTTELREIQIGLESEDYMEITEGLVVGDEVLLPE